MRLLYVCRSVDEERVATGHQAGWVRALAAHPDVEHVHVLTTVLGRVDLPDNVTVRVFGAHRGQFIRFLVAAVRAMRTRPDAFLVSQGGPWPALLLPLKLATRRRLYHWYAMGQISRGLRWQLRFCDDLLFTATPGSVPVDSPKIRVIGHGIDTDRFIPGSEPPTRDVVTMGRIAPIKGIESMLEALALCRDRYDARYTFDVVGRVTGDHRAYRESLVTRVEELGLGDQVSFVGPRPYEMVASLLPTYRLALNFSGTALDKAVLEAMAAGVAVVSTNPCVAEILPADLRPRVMAPVNDPAAQAEAIHAVLSLPAAERHELTGRLREIVVQDHRLDRQFAQLVQIMKDDIGGVHARA